jgi:hypothetical protein
MLFEIPYAGKFKATSERDRENSRIVSGLITQWPDIFERSRYAGHITASAIILNKARNKMLLTHHRKLDWWLQLGGHCDGIKDPLHVAKMEGYEESGLKRLEIVSDVILDIDIHTIPNRGIEPEHTHYDFRYVFTADEHEELTVSEESCDLKWVALDKLFQTTQNHSMQIMRDKLAYPPFL